MLKCLDKDMATRSSILAWKIPWTEEPGRFMGSLGVGTTERLHFHFPFSCIGEGNGNPLHYSCLKSPGDGGERGGLSSMGSHRVGLHWSDLAAAAAVGCWNVTMEIKYITIHCHEELRPGLSGSSTAEEEPGILELYAFFLTVVSCPLCHWLQI